MKDLLRNFWRSSDSEVASMDIVFGLREGLSAFPSTTIPAGALRVVLSE
jgi:hypothetical protein